MPRKPLSVRTTLYRVHGITKLDEAVSPKYLNKEGFDAIPTSVNGLVSIDGKKLAVLRRGGWRSSRQGKWSFQRVAQQLDESICHHRDISAIMRV